MHLAGVTEPPASTIDTAGGPPVRDRRSLGGSTAVFALWTTASRFVGLVREIVAAAVFGTSGAINAFVVAFQVPNLLRSLVADSALSAAFVPAFTELEERGDHAAARRLAGSLAGVITLALGVLTLLAIVTAPWVMPIFAPGLPPQFENELVALSQIIFPIVILLGLTGLVTAILQAAGEFASSAFVPVLWNLVIIAALAIMTPFLDSESRIYAYAVGVLVGTLAQLLYLLPDLRGKGPFPRSLDFANRHMRRVLTMMVPVTIALGLININLVVDTAFASLVDGDESIRAIDAAFRLYILPQGIFSVAISTVLFPAISRLAANGDIRGLRRTVARGLRQIFFLLLPASAFLMVLAEPVVRLVFQRGEFDASSTALTSGALFAFTLGLVFNGASLLVIRAFFAIQKPWLPTKVAFGGLILNAVLDLILYRPLGTKGIPLATSITSLVTFIALVWLLSVELGGLHGRVVMSGFWRIAATSCATGLAAWLVWRAVDGTLGRGFFGQLLSVSLAAAAGAAATFIAARALALPERKILAGLGGSLR